MTVKWFPSSWEVGLQLEQYMRTCLSNKIIQRFYFDAKKKAFYIYETNSYYHGLGTLLLWIWHLRSSSFFVRPAILRVWTSLLNISGANTAVPSNKPICHQAPSYATHIVFFADFTVFFFFSFFLSFYLLWIIVQQVTWNYLLKRTGGYVACLL